MPSATPEPEASGTETASAATPDPKRYVWLNDKGRDTPGAKSTLSAAIPTPPGYQRVAVQPGSFAAWLRDLPVAGANTPVVNWRGTEVYSGNDDYVEAVIALDVGKADRQQSTDVILRFDAEWLWSQGRRDMTYRAATKDLLPYAEYSAGKRVVVHAGHIYWVKQKSPTDLNDRPAFRDYLDTVFTWVSQTSIRMQSNPVDPKDVRPGDFFLQTGKGGYLVVILDIAEKPSGQRVALLGQSLYPAMNVYVARLGRGTPWFSLRPPDPILTAHTKELKWGDLRRLEAVSAKNPNKNDDADGKNDDDGKK